MQRSWQQVARAWRDSGEFRDEFSKNLASQPHAAFAWETVPVSAATRHRPFEQVVIDSPSLARVTADPAPFAAHFRDAQGGVCTFANLGGDARLVVPTPEGPIASYAHLAAFVRDAPPRQVHALWSAVGRAVEAHWQASQEPVWVSTAGLGVHWLHVRLDTRPKYYRHAPYRDFTACPE